MRRIAAGVAAVLAVVLLPLGLLSSWIADVVTDTDEYVATVAPLAKDPEVKDAAARLLARQTTDAVDDVLGPIGGTLEVLIRHAARTIVDSDAFPPAWRAANRSAHAQLINVLEGNDIGLPGGRVSINLSTLLNTVVADMAERVGVPADSVPQVPASFGLVKAEDIEKAREIYNLLDWLGYWLPVFWLSALIAALALSRDRLWLLGRIGIGSVVSLFALRIGLDVLERQLKDSSVDAEITGAVWRVVTDSLYQAIFIGIVVSLLVPVIAIGVGRFRRAR